MTKEKRIAVVMLFAKMILTECLCTDSLVVYQLRMRRVIVMILLKL